MSIASEITRIKNAVADAYQSCDEKGATMPAVENVANLAETIDTISGGGSITAYLTVKNCYVGSTVSAINGTNTYTATADENGDAVITIEALGIYTITAPYKYAYATKAITESGNYSMYVHNVPQEYQELSYIESTGTQRIDTGVTPTIPLTINSKFAFTRVGNDNVFGSNKGSTCRFDFYSNEDGTMCARIFKARAERTGATYSVNQLLNFSLVYNSEINYTAKINDNNITINAGSETTNFSLYLFGANNDGTAAMSNVRIYSFSITTNEASRNFVPCYRKSDGVAGLWDSVTNQLFTNAGTGEFICGVPVNSLPVGYKQVEYIGSTGTQHIATSYNPNQNTKIQTEYVVTNNNVTGQLFGARGVSSTAKSFNLFAESDGNDVMRFDFYLTVIFPQYNLTEGVKHSFNNYSNYAYIDGAIKYYSSTISPFTAPVGMAIFCCNTNGQLDHKGYFNLYKLRANESIPHIDFVPCITPNNEVGLYDVVTNTFFGNSGTGVFIAGAEVPQDAYMEVAA